MVCIIGHPTRYLTKKSIKEAIAAGISIEIEDPSFLNPRVFSTHQMELGEKVIVTNHPKRSYFVTIEKRVDGTFKVY